MLVRYAVVLTVASVAAMAQVTNTSSPNVASVLLFSATQPPINYVSSGGSQVTFNSALTGIYTERNGLSDVTNAGTYESAFPVLQAATVIDANIGIALSILPLPSPASGLVYKTDPVTGVEVPASGTLGPIFTERAETIGKNKYYISVTHQDFHFSSYDGQSLNGLNLLSPGGQSSGVVLGSQPQSTVPSTLTMGADIRLSQNVAFLTYGATNRIDVSVAVPLMHAAVASEMYNATIYAGDGMGHPYCWCVDTGTPGLAPTAQSPNGLYLPVIAKSSLGKTGIGDVLFRVKGTVVESGHIDLALGADLRLPTGDAMNFLGTGTTSVRPFAALSLHPKQAGKIVVAPHLNLGWQLSGKSVLAGNISATPETLVAGQTTSYSGPPYTFSKGTLPDVLSWAAGSEVAFGPRNTFVFDILGNQIGLINGIPTAVRETENNLLSPIPPTYSPVSVSGITPLGCGVGASSVCIPGRTSFGEYSAAIGYKAKVVGGLVITFNMLVRLDNNGLVARAVPLYGLGYEF